MKKSKLLTLVCLIPLWVFAQPECDIQPAGDFPWPSTLCNLSVELPVEVTGFPGPPLIEYDYGDGNTGNSSSYTYAESGTYEVCVTASRVGFTCVAEYCQSVSVSADFPLQFDNCPSDTILPATLLATCENDTYLPQLSASDCGAASSFIDIVCERTDGNPLDAPWPEGTTGVICTATNIATGESVVCDWKVGVDSEGCLDDACDLDCQVDSIIISTGYDQINGGLLPTGEYDPLWTVVETPNPSLSVPRPAYVLQPNGAWAISPDAKWISVFPDASFNDDNESPEPPYGFELCFCVCEPQTNITIDVTVRSDNFHHLFLQDADDINILDLTTTLGNHNLPPVTANETISLTQGNYCLRADLRNTGGTAMGLQIAGTVTGQGLSSLLCCNSGGAITGQKYFDQNCDGTQGTTEPGLAGWEIQLCDANGAFLQSTITDAAGYYTFTGVPAGGYIVKEVNQSGWMPGNPTSGQYEIQLGPLEVIGGLEFGNCENICGTITGDVNSSCEPVGSYVYDLQFANNTEYEVTSVVLNAITPEGVTLSQQYFNFYQDPIPANGGTSLPVELIFNTGGLLSESLEVCFDVIYLTDNAECCHYEHCVVLQPPRVCQLVQTEALEANDSCCYSVNLINDFCPDYFVGIQTEILTPGVTFSEFDGGAAWTTLPNVDGNSILWTPISGSLPLGDLQDLQFCLSDIISVDQYPQEILVSWLAEDPATGEKITVCTEILEFFCEPCLLLDGITSCESDQHTFEFDLMNNAGMPSTLIVFEVHTPNVLFEPAFFEADLEHGDIFSSTVNIYSIDGSPLPDDLLIEFKALLFDDNGWCCHLDDYTIQLGSCIDSLDDCNCEELAQAVGEGFEITHSCDNGQAMLTPTSLEECDRVTWSIRRTGQLGSIMRQTIGNESASFNFGSGGKFSIRMTVERFLDDGTSCFEEQEFTTSQSIIFDCNPDDVFPPIGSNPGEIFPVPAVEYIRFTSGAEGVVQLEVYNTNGQVLIQQQREMSKAVPEQLDIHMLPEGVYFLRMIDENGQVNQRRFVKTLK